MMDEKGKVYSKRIYNITDQKIRDKIFRYSPFCHPAIMMRTDILKKSGGYNPELVYAEDYDLYFRMGMYSQFANLQKTLIRYRMFE